MRQILSFGVRDYFSDGWNWVELSSHASIVATHMTSVLGVGNKMAVLHALTSVTIYASIVSYMRAYTLTGPLVRMITEILRDMVVFTIVVVVLSLGFLGAFAILLPSSEAFRGFNGLLTMFNLLLGDFDLDTFEGDTSVKTNVAIGLFVVYMFFIVIVLLNMLIAIMGDSYGRVSENAEVVARIERARVLVDIDHTWHRWLSRRCYPRCLHVLAPASEGDGGEDGESGGASSGPDWAGRISTLRSDLAQDIKSTLSTVAGGDKGGDVAKLAAQVDSIAEQMTTDRDDLNAKLENILKLLATKGEEGGKKKKAHHHAKKKEEEEPAGGDGKKEK